MSDTAVAVHPEFVTRASNVEASWRKILLAAIDDLLQATELLYERRGIPRSGDIAVTRMALQRMATSPSLSTEDLIGFSRKLSQMANDLHKAFVDLDNQISSRARME